VIDAGTRSRNSRSAGYFRSRDAKRLQPITSYAAGGPRADPAALYERFRDGCPPPTPLAASAEASLAAGERVLL